MTPRLCTPLAHTARSGRPRRSTPRTVPRPHAARLLPQVLLFPNITRNFGEAYEAFGYVMEAAGPVPASPGVCVGAR